MVQQLYYGKSITQSPRVEIRRCPPLYSGDLQILAWGKAATQEPLVVNTHVLSIEEAVAVGGVFVLEGARETNDEVFVIRIAEGDPPKLLLRSSARGMAEVTVSRWLVAIVIPKGFGRPPERHSYAIEH